ncbi:alpha-ketoacid dehydrogenase subunit beta [Fusibacter paucivorans]|uniref:Alpha-ketoacid dehydrogenase subunit beta n=1 Tax=Fusibacter paucivorans TaxID=76009 RepID=A0ABS5PU09_9FIRM|nr:transketolase C-terminal domain-containing protein [Fusibacter paucivorans]MBS7528581.1 alpha-ketoacid dehydrogenase subunit beta [Fusibacter paucivorans]
MRVINNLTAQLEAFREEMLRDESVIMIGEDIGAHGGMTGETVGFLEQFGPERILSATLAESAQASFAVGAAMGGQRAIVDYMCADFMAYAYDGIVNQAGKQRYFSAGQWEYPVVFIAPHGVGMRIAGQHETSVEGWFQNCAGLKIYTPMYPSDVKGLLKYAIRENDPVVFLMPRFSSTKGEVPDLDVEHIIEPGKASIVKEGKDVTIVTYQHGIELSLEAAKTLEAEGISCEIMDLRTLIPFDKKGILDAVKKTGRLVVVTEAPKRGGFGNNIINLVAEEGFSSLKAPMRYVGGKDYPIPYGPGEDFVVPTIEEIVTAVKSIM